MPVTPLFDWEQSLLDVTIKATIKGFKADAIDVFISDVFVKVNAAPTYLLALDLLHPIIVKKSSFRIDGAIVKITLPKVTEQIWDTLRIDTRTYFSREGDAEKKRKEKEKKAERDLPSRDVGGEEKAISLRVEEIPSEEDEDEKEGNDHDPTTTTTPTTIVDPDADSSSSIYRPKSLKERRKAAIQRAEQLYKTKLDTREKQKAIEKKRMHHEQWELERLQRQAIIDKVQREKADEQERLYQWEEAEKAKMAAKNLKSPADIATLANEAVKKAAAAGTTPGIRNVGETANYTINFTPKSLAAPTRSRGDEDYYRKSKYRPVSVEDSPMFWKDRADKHYRARDFKSAAEAYTESIKRDGVFLSCVSNRAACYIHLHEYKKAIEDCDLALTLLANTPASDTTQDRYKAQMCKLHARRAAAKCWDGQYSAGLEDLRLATAYRNAEEDSDIVADLATLEEFMQRMGIAETQQDPNAHLSSRAAQLYYAGKYEEAISTYKDMLVLNQFDVKARNNMAASLLHLGRFKEAIAECEQVISFCGEVAAALKEPGAVTSSSLQDSDDEEEGEDEMVMRRNEAARKIGERSGHVYLLLKAHVRSAAAYCGLKDYRRGFEFMELAVRITPYDDDLREDANKMLEKLKFNTLISASTGGGAAVNGSANTADGTRSDPSSKCADGSCPIQH